MINIYNNLYHINGSSLSGTSFFEFSSSLPCADNYEFRRSTMIVVLLAKILKLITLTLFNLAMCYLTIISILRLIRTLRRNHN
jgi:hypothetical protein